MPSSKAGRGRSLRQPDEQFDVPRVSDGVIFRVLSNLLILDGERLSYRTLDVEQIGSVYEAMMGFDLEVAQGARSPSSPSKSHGAPTTINLEELLAAKASRPGKWLKEQTDQKLTGQAARCPEKSRDASTTCSRPWRRRSPTRSRPNVVPKGAMIFQPSDERRRSGSHYTPRSSPSRSSARRSNRSSNSLGDPADARADPRPEDLRPGDGLRRVPGGSLPATWRRAGQGLARAQAGAAGFRRMRMSPARPPADRPALPLRRGQEPDGRGPGEAVALAGDAGQGPSLYVPGSRPAHGDSLVGLTRKQIADFHWQPTPQRSLRPGNHRAANQGRDERPAGDHRSRRRRRLLAQAAKAGPRRRKPEPGPVRRQPGHRRLLRWRQRQETQGETRGAAATVLRVSANGQHGPAAHRRRSRTCAQATRRFTRFIGRSSFRRSSAARTAGSMRWSAIRRSLGENSSSSGNRGRLSRLAYRRFTTNRTATRIWSPISFAARLTCSSQVAFWPDRDQHDRPR